MSTLGSGVFLGMSWTWLVGMVLPVFLVADFGWPGWVAFAVPNVLGAMSVGFLFRSRQASQAFEHRHDGAMRWFSIYTIVFHLAVAGGIFGTIMRRAASMDAALAIMIAIGLMLGIVLVGIGHSRRNNREAVAAGWATLAISLGVFAWLAVQQARGANALSIAPAAQAPLGAAQLALMAPAIVLGFLACPHLDLTIHRVRRCVPEWRSKQAFALGFGVFFLAMIVFTLLYAGPINAASLAAGTLVLPWALLIHFGAQSALTVGLHWRELEERPSLQNLLLPGLIVGVTLGAAFALLPWVEAWVPAESVLRPSGKSLVQLSYEVLITAYALVFPSYLWTRVIVSEKLGLLSVNASARAWWISSLIASPGFAVGYLLQHFVWLAVGVAVLLILPVLLGIIQRAKGQSKAAQA